MLKAPLKYIERLIESEKEKDITTLVLRLIKNCDKDLHFIIDEKELRIADIISKLS